MVVDEKLNSARDEALVENTAQAVFKDLTKLFREESRFRSRWVWELLQNARDASPDGGVNVWLIQEPHRVIFRHNGLPFTDKNIAHLIYHGSTKYGTEIGEFGTGFLTTHLISKTVAVKGRMDDGREFDFMLDRRGDNAEELKAAMDKSWEAFTESLTQGTFHESVCNTTEYGYPLASEVLAVVTERINDLITNAPYLLAFNGRIRSVHVEHQDRSVTIEKTATEPLGERGSQRVHVVECGPGCDPVSRYLIAITDNSTSVAVETAKVDAKWSIAEQEQTPRIFKAFPLIGTRDFCLPIVINDERFRPRQERDTLFLVQGREPGPNPDMVRMEVACDLAASLAVLAAKEGWDGAAKLVRLNRLREWNWVDGNWFRRSVSERFIQPLRAATVMATAAGRGRPPRAAGDLGTDGMIAPSAGTIPLFSDPELCCALWDVAVQVKSLSGKLPRRDEAHVWADNLASWAPFLGQPPERLSESLTLEKLCEQVSKWGTMAELKKQLGRDGFNVGQGDDPTRPNDDPVDPVEWLNQLHALIGKAGATVLFESAHLIPSQSGALKKMTELRRDPGIDEELKNIAESLGMPVRDDLLDRRMRLKEQEDLTPKTQDEVLTAAIQRLKDKAKSAGVIPAVSPLRSDLDRLAAAAALLKTLKQGVKSVDTTFPQSTAIQLFVWLVRHDEIDKLDAFPVLTRATTADDAALTTLLRDPAKLDERPLAPLGCWPESARMVAYLFPKQQTLSDAYREALPDDQLWGSIAEKGYVRLTPVYETRRQGVPFIPDEPLPVSEKDTKLKHRAKDAVKVSTLAFFEKEETGLNAVRRSKTRAVALLLFLAKYVLEVEPGVLDAIEADCECGGKHRYYPAAWLVPMWDRRWVPLGDGKQDSATAETIALLFDGREEELRQLTAGKGRRLLEALGISLADLSLRAVAKDENTRVFLIEALGDIVRAADNDVAKVKLVAEEIKQSPELLDKIRDHRATREKIHRNQSFGAEVERLLKETLKDHNLKVTRTGVGSDYEVEEDYIVDGKEIMLALEGERRSFLIEVKATVGNVVRMTVTQAETAVNG